MFLVNSIECLNFAARDIPRHHVTNPQGGRVWWLAIREGGTSRENSNRLGKGRIMRLTNDRAFIGGRDYEVYETAERASQRRIDDREAEMAANAYDSRVSPQGNRGELTPAQTTFPTDSTHTLGPNEAARLAKKYGKCAPVEMDRDELAEGPALPHRDDTDISTVARDTAWKAGYYQAGTDAYSSDAHMGNDPIARKARGKRTYQNGNGETYVVPVGLPSQYRYTTKDGNPVQPHQVQGWGKSLTSKNKHLAYWRDPTADEALSNVRTGGNRTQQKPNPADYHEMIVPREYLVMLARVNDIQAARGRIENDGKGDMLRELATLVPAGENVTVTLYSPTEVRGMFTGLPKRYKNGDFGQFLKDIATNIKLQK
jgi:hypothetical protein